MSKNKFRFVVIGSGNISNTYAAAVEKLNDAEIVGLVSRSKIIPDWANNNIEVVNRLSEIENDFDAVIICTPNSFHHISAIEAAHLKKHVLCEKPLDISLESIDKIISACKTANVKLGISYQRRMAPDLQTIKSMIVNDEFGKIFAAELTINNYRDDNYYKLGGYRGTWQVDGGGPFMQQASHYIDIYSWFFGKPQRVVSMLGTFLHQIETEDHGAALLKHPNGMIGTIVASTAAKPGFDALLVIHSEKGTFKLENDIITLWSVEGIENPANSQNVKIFSGASSFTVEDTFLHETIISDFINAVKSDKEPYVNGESARLTTEIILQIYNNSIS